MVENPSPTAWVLFADIDGTLWCGRERRLVLARRLARAMECARVVLASSRTIEEILWLEDWLGAWPDFIAENGAQIVVRDDQLAGELATDEQLPRSDGPRFVRRLGADLAALEPALREAATRHGLMDVVAEAPGWPGAQPVDAAPFRRASVLLPRRLFTGGAHSGFLGDLAARGLDATSGGEWTSISRGASKGDAARAFADAVGRQLERPPRTAAIGNSDNDASLMAAVDRAFVIRNPDGHAPALASLPNAILLHRLACGGWHEALARFPD